MYRFAIAILLTILFSLCLFFMYKLFGQDITFCAIVLGFIFSILVMIFNKFILKK